MTDYLAVLKPIRTRLERRARRYRIDANLCGYCGLGAGWTLQAFQRAGLTGWIVAREWSTGLHCYVRNRTHVFDLTATQFESFSSTPILIAPIADLSEYPYYGRGKRFDTIPAFRAWQRQVEWNPTEGVV